MKATAALLSLSLCLPIMGEVYTVPEGYTKIPIPAGTVSGPTLTAISATLLNDLEHSSAVTINADFAGDPTNTQTVTVTGASWGANVWTGVPYLAYLVNTDGSEEAYLITSHTADTLTISTTFDLLSSSRFPASSTLKIRKANTVGSILGTTTTPFTISDRVFIWDSGNWETLVNLGGNWGYFGGPNNGNPANNVVVFPEEGLFVQRGETTPAELTLFGEVPSAPQASTVATASSYFISTRYPVGDSPAVNPTGIELQNLGIQDLPNWGISDRVYVWTGTGWQTFVYLGGSWGYFGGPQNGDNADGFLVSPNSALFLTKSSAGTEAESPLNVPLPYVVD